MNKFLLACVIIAAIALPCLAKDQDEDQDNNRSSELTPNAPRKVTMANPAKPAWQAEPHGK